jgi:hypothetical protein
MSKARSFLGTALRRLLVIAVIGAIGYGGYLVFGPTARANDEPLEHASDLETLCWYQRRYYPDAAAYTGSAPHPVQIFEQSDSQTSDPGWFPAQVRQPLPQHWWLHHKTPTKVQLIACVEVSDEGPRIGECEFRGQTIPMHQGVYSATLYEAKTGEKVAEERLAGRTDFNEDMCPILHTWREGEDPKLLSRPDAAEYRRALGRYVDG